MVERPFGRDEMEGLPEALGEGGRGAVAGRARCREREKAWLELHQEEIDRGRYHRHAGEGASWVG